MKISPERAVLQQYGPELVADAAAFIETHLRAETVTKGPYITDTCRRLTLSDKFDVWADAYAPADRRGVWVLINNEGAAVIQEAASLEEGEAA